MKMWPTFVKKTNLPCKRPFLWVVWALMVISVSSSNHYDDHIGDDNSYDFIIVGGGTGGNTVARRLAEGGQYKVLIIESGGLPKPLSEVPVYAPTFLLDNDVTFQYDSVPQTNASLFTNGIAKIFCGRMMGGTSSLNYMYFNRGSPRDYNSWAKAVGDKSWNYANMLKHFKRVETYAGDYPSDQHGYNGPLTISRPRYAPGLNHWLAAGKQLGYQISDPNGPQRISFSPVEFSKKYGRRVSSYTGYLKPILGQSNLHVLMNTNATEIIFEGKRAVGVRFETGLTNLGFHDNCVYAKKEVIISAGAYGSPQLLMRSGIGPRSVLRTAGITPIHELPVGKNFHDHVAIPLMVAINNRLEVYDPARDLNSANFRLYNRTGDGPYAVTQGLTGQAFVASPVAKSEGNSDWADVQLWMSHSTDLFLTVGDQPPNATLASWEAPMSLTVFLVRPKSRGSITLTRNRSAAIDFNIFGDYRDMRASVYGVREMLEIMGTDAYRKLGARLIPVNFPACNRFQQGSDDYWECYIRHTAVNGCHPVGSCKMGSRSDPTAVVDHQLRVIGIDGLRVVDASVMPAVTNANTQAPVYGIAEKASDLILKEWKPSNKRG